LPFRPLTGVSDTDRWLSGRTVFVASGSRVQAAALAAFVREWDGTPVVVHDIERLKDVGAGAYDACVVDWKLDGGSGADVLDRLSESGMNLPPTVMLVEVMKGIDLSARLDEQGVQVCLKPVRKRCLERSLRAVLDRRGFQPVAPSSLAEPDLSKPVRVLIAEDSESNRNLFALYLSKTSAVADMAVNGLDAYEMAVGNDYDVILMDMEMPVMDGFEAAKKIREHERETGSPATPMYALTAHAFSEYRDRCDRIGCNGYLTKPIKKMDFLRILFS